MDDRNKKRKRKCRKVLVEFCDFGSDSAENEELATVDYAVNTRKFMEITKRFIRKNLDNGDEEDSD